jgi:uncharacterized protein YerC
MNMKQHPYHTHIFVTEDGRVFSNKTGRLKELKQSPTDRGYLDVSILVSKGRSLKKRVHRVVAETYLENPHNLREVDHIDCDKQNNNLYNLEWVSSKENKRRARANGLYDNTVGEKHHNCILTEEQVHQVCKCLQDGVRNKDIAEMMGVHKDTIGHIKQGDIWKEISQNYVFSIKRNKRKSIDFLKKVCEMIANGKTNNEIFSLFEGEITINDVQRIRVKNIHKTISDSYF